jgi:hypothetical protein
MEPDITYTYDADGTLKVLVTYDVKVYSAFSLESILGESNDPFALTGHGGVDFGGGVEYPLFEFLDIGATITHMPLVPAVLNDYMQMEGTVGIETDDLIGAITGDDGIDSVLQLPGDEGTVYGKDNKTILRPFKMIFDADYRPFNTKLLSLKPSLGFAISPLYVRPFVMEGGLTVQTNVINLLVAAVGINYTDHLWKNHLDLAINLRALELDLGVGLQSESFTKSWSSGFAIVIGIKVGW